MAPIKPLVGFSRDSWGTILNAALDTIDARIDTEIARATAAEGASVTGGLAKASNLSDLANAATARTNLGLGTAAVQNLVTLDGRYVKVGDTQIDIGLYASGSGVETTAIQGAINAAPAGAVINFRPRGGGSYTLDAALVPSANGQRFLFGPGVVINQTIWQKPVIDVLDRDDITIENLDAVFTGTRGGVGPTQRAENGYALATPVWTNSKRTKIYRLRCKNFAMAVAFLGWDTGSSTSVERKNVDCVAEDIYAEGADFPLLWEGSDGLRVNRLTARSLIDSSAGANPIHAFYGTGNSAFRSYDVQIRDALCYGNAIGHAFQVKYNDGFQFFGGVAEQCFSLFNMIDCVNPMVGDLTFRNGVGDIAGNSLFTVQEVTANSARGIFRNVVIETTPTAQAYLAKAVAILADDCTFEDFLIVTNRSVSNDNYDVSVGTATLPSNRVSLDRFRIRNSGAEGRSFALGNASGTPSTDLTLRDFRTANSRQLVDVYKGTTGVLVEYNPADQRSTGTFPNNGIGPLTAGTEATVTVTRRCTEVVTKTVNYTATQYDSGKTFLMNGSSITLTLPSAVLFPKYGMLRVKNLHSTTLTIAATAGNIDGLATTTATQYVSTDFISDGTNWSVV